MAVGRHFQTVMSSYVTNCSTDRHEIWNDQAQCPNELYRARPYTTLTILSNNKNASGDEITNVNFFTTTSYM